MRGLARRLRNWVRTAAVATRLLVAVRRPGTAELWIGDSHAVCFNEDLTSTELTVAPEGQFVWHLGPRLMYALARDGFPRRVVRAAGFLGKVARRSAVIPVFVAGEIDVRCHLVPHSRSADFDLSFVRDYVAAGCALASTMGATVAVFAVPPPPSEDCPAVPDFPIRGSFDERIAMFTSLRAAVKSAVDEGGPVRAILLDATDELTDDVSALRSDLTDDGCHTNARGVSVVRRRFRDLGVVPSTQSLGSG